jgi:Fic family protein
MATYIHQNPDWPSFTWNQAQLTELLTAVRHRQGRLLGRMESLGFSLRKEAVLETLTQDVLKSSEIEGKFLNRAQVRSSVARRLGMDIGASAPADRNVEGVVEMMLDATQKFDEPFIEDRLFGWHSALFPTGRSGMTKIVVGAWRDDAEGPMQVVSGSIGFERVHFEAPAATKLNHEMTQFINWFDEDTGIDLVLKSAIAHFWFVTIHPFEDGNGRIGRALSDLLLARSENTEQRFYSVSSQIRDQRDSYYAILESTSKGGLDITPWLKWFLNCLDKSIEGAEVLLNDVLRKSRFWESRQHESFNDRQRKVINRLFDGFEGKLTSSKWALLTKCSHDTALRDIENLVQKGVLAKNEAGGRSTSYSLVEG